MFAVKHSEPGATSKPKKALNHSLPKAGAVHEGQTSELALFLP